MKNCIFSTKYNLINKKGHESYLNIGTYVMIST